MSPIAQQLRRAYYESGLTYDQLAARAEVSHNTVTRCLHGRGTVASMLRLCIALEKEVRIVERSA